MPDASHDPAEPNGARHAEAAQSEADVDAVIAACGDMRSAIRSLLIANAFLRGELERTAACYRTSVSRGFTRGRMAADGTRFPRRE